MADSSERKSPLTFLLVAANLVMLLWITVSYIRQDRSSPSTKPDNTYTYSTHSVSTASGQDAIPDLPDIDESAFFDEEEPEYIQDNSSTPAGNTGYDTDDNSMGHETAQYSDIERPGYEDFDWYISDVSFYGMWDDAQRITDLGEILGPWKAYIYYDPQNVTGSPCQMLFNTDISAGQNDIAILCDWYYFKYKNSEPQYEDDDTYFYGYWDGSAIYAEGNGWMNLNGFYARDGKQYAIGDMEDKNGVAAIIAMVRDKE